MVADATAERGWESCGEESNDDHLSSSILFNSKSNSSRFSAFSYSSPSSSSSSSSTPQSYPSPPHNPLLKTPSALSHRRCQSIDRPRFSPLFPCSDLGRALRTTTRRLSVSFQNESFYFQTSEAKPTTRKPTTEYRKSIALFDGSENSQPNKLQMRRHQTVRTREPNYLSRSSDSSVDSVTNPILLTVLLQLDETSDRSQSLDSDCSLSKNNPKVPSKAHGICVPARFRLENGCYCPLAESPQRNQKSINGKQQPLSIPQLLSPKFIPNALYDPKSCSPRKNGTSRITNIMKNYFNGESGSAPSIISFASEVRRAKKGEGLIEDAHMLRLFHNRYLQWRYINARAKKALSKHFINVKDNLHDAWIAISKLQELAMTKQIKLQVLMRNMKLASILKGQIAFLNQWPTLDNEHETSLIGVIKALKASTLRLPLTGRAKVNIQELSDAITSTAAVMQSMTVSIYSLFSKVEEISSIASELAKLAAFERALLEQSRYLLSVVAALHIKQWSLHSYMLQLGRKTIPICNCRGR